MENKTQGAATLREKRTERGLSLLDAADLLGISESMMSRIENGHRDPGRAIVQRIHEVFGIEYEEWFRHVA